MPGRDRLDKILVKKGFFKSRSQAKRAIMAGKVFVDNQLVDKAGSQFKPTVDIEVKGDPLPYVSRGGLKLARALQVFPVDPAGLEVIDIGASTGGFTDCLLQEGASRVYAVDVGYGQLDWKLRKDDRVEVIERTNFRYLTPEELPVEVPLIVTDVSFISLRLIIPAALKFLQENGEIIALIKPQFEAGRERVGKKGVVKAASIHEDVIRQLSEFFVESNLEPAGLDFSPITGAGSNNIEFLIYLKRKYQVKLPDNWIKKIKDVVKQAHRKLAEQ